MPTNAQLPMSFGVSQFTTMPWTFDEDVERYARLGVEAIEIVEDKLDPARFEQQLRSVAEAGLSISAVQPAVRTFFASRMVPEPKRLEDRVARLRSSIERLAPFAPGAPFITNVGAHPAGNMDEAILLVTRELKALAPLAADHGVRLAIEPLNPTSVNVESAIWTVEQALAIIEGTGHDEVGLCLDYWNVWQNADILGQIARSGTRIFTVQASDWRTPRSFADRIVPGDGIIPLAALMRATRDSGFEGPYVVEIFSNEVQDSLYDGDLGSVIERSRSGMAAAWHDSWT